METKEAVVGVRRAEDKKETAEKTEDDGPPPTPALTTCSEISNCGDCLSDGVFSYHCFWCPLDLGGKGQCHAKGSIETSCTTANCISRSTFSTCKGGGNPPHCPSPSPSAIVAERVEHEKSRVSYEETAVAAVVL